jgi:dephospho-CoA kinase
VATSGVVEPPKSPFTFAEKKKMMILAGVSSKDIHQVKNPYRPDEILKSHNSKNTTVVFAVSEKDMAEDPRFKFSAKSYLQPLPKDTSKLEGYEKRGYIVTTPTFPFSVLGHKMKGASQIRDLFTELKPAEQKELVADLFGKYDDGVYKIMASKLKSTKKSVKQLKEGITHKEFGPMLDAFVDFAVDHLKLDSKPKIKLMPTDDQRSSFGGYMPSLKELVVCTKDRHPMDVFRTVAHELVHHKQNLEGRIKDASKEGETGSDIENEANAKAGVIMRNFAKSNPNAFGLTSITEEMLNEGLYDKSIFKVVFLAGGPGSGKDFILKHTIAGHGLVEINSDKAFEYLMDKNNLDPRMPDHETAQRDLVRGRAKNITNDRNRLALAGRLGLIINGTGDDYEKTEKMKATLERMGYDTMMVFVNTSNEVSYQRNIERGSILDKKGRPGRTVKETIRSEKWLFSQANIGKYQALFGARDFIVIDNNINVRNTNSIEKKEFEDSLLRVYKIVASFTQRPLNGIAKDWLHREADKRGVLQLKLSEGADLNTDFEEYMIKPANREIGTKSLADIYAKVTPGQYPIPEKAEMKKVKVVLRKKVVAQEDALTARKLPIGGGYGPEIAESIVAWASSQATQDRFALKYGDQAEVKLNEAVKALNEAGLGNTKVVKKTIHQIRESKKQ